MASVEMTVLPADEQLSVWSETERNFWRKFEEENEANHAQSEQDYKRIENSIKNHLDDLARTRSQLTQRQEVLLKELMQVEKELARLSATYDDQVTKVNALEIEYRNGEQDRLEKFSEIANTMERFFRKKRGEDPDAPSSRDVDHLHSILKNCRNSHDSRTQSCAGESQPTHTDETKKHTLPPIRAALLPRHTNHSSKVLVDIVDTDGHFIGPLERVEPWNQWIKAILDLPVRRPVKIRHGRIFTNDDIATLYDRSETKGARWLACMIQATGDIQRQRCLCCARNQGAFEECVIVGGPLFQKCGSCEWNRQECHMSNLDASRSASYYSQPVNSYSSRDADMVRSSLPHLSRRSPLLPEPVQLPTPKENRHHIFVNSIYPAGGVGITAKLPSRRPSQDIPTPSVQSADNSPQLARGSLPSPSDSDEITRNNLILRHDGTVYTYPDCVAGVPLAKIDETHSYWDSRWPRVQSLIEPQLELWREKYETAISNKTKQPSSTKFQTGRQVNRGMKILEFLQDGDISPYQLLARKYTHTGKGAITAYDTLFRMCETLGELAKFKLDISPVEWLRHRLHELIVEKGSNFNYAKTMHDFYHDSKLTALRAKNGFKSIGRPSGYKAGQTVGANSTPQSIVKKRKNIHSQTNTPRATPSADNSPLQQVNDEFSRSPPAAETAVRAPPQKRFKPLSPISVPPSDEFYTECASETDSFSGAMLEKLDWRVYQVKSRLFTSSTNVTQYLHWNEDERMFEHQVLKDMDPVSWGVHLSPVDFNIALDDITQVDWNIDALQIHLVMSQFGSSVAKQDGKPRGDIMAAFKRVTTMRRFLSYCRQRRLKVVKVTADEMEQRWGKMQSEKLPAHGSEEASLALRE